jgi:hypothetical protein
MPRFFTGILIFKGLIAGRFYKSFSVKGLKKVQKQEFLAAFHKLYDRAKACIYANRAHFE